MIEIIKGKIIIPIGLIFLRGMLGILILLTTIIFPNQYNKWIAFFIVLGLLSDIFDGIIARRFQVATIGLRRLDSQIDVLFWLCVGISTFLLHPDIFNKHLFSICGLIVLEISCYVISWIKFGKETCTHCYTAKLFGLSLFTFFFSTFCFGYSEFLFQLMIIIGVISHIDVILITLLLPKWTNDIPSAYHAWLIRKGKSFKKYKIFN